MTKKTQQTTYKEAFADAVTDLIAENITDRPARISAIQALTDAYYGSTGEQPDTAQLERLADYVLTEELTDMSRSKTFNEEYPFLSERQFERRIDREYSLDLAENYDVDGVNRAKPERRHRTAKESRFVDKMARKKNRARNAQYKRDTTAGPVVTYNLNLYENGGKLPEEFVACKEVAATWRERLCLVY